MAEFTLCQFGSRVDQQPDPHCRLLGRVIPQLHIRPDDQRQTTLLQYAIYQSTKLRLFLIRIRDLFVSDCHQKLLYHSPICASTRFRKSAETISGLVGRARSDQRGQLTHCPISRDELFSLIASRPTCYPMRSPMHNSLTTRHLSLAPSIPLRWAKIRFRKTNSDGTNPPIVVHPDQTTTSGVNLPSNNLLFPSPEGRGVRGEIAFHVRFD